MMRILLGAALGLAGCAAAWGQLAAGGDVKWAPAPPSMPKGVEMAVLVGDPGKPGPYVIRIKAPPGLLLRSHVHGTAENVTVLSGDWHVAYGAKVDQPKDLAMSPGGFNHTEPGVVHTAWSEHGAVLQIHGEGPLTTRYVGVAEPSSVPK